jgi:hypothetical protein
MIQSYLAKDKKLNELVDHVHGAFKLLNVQQVPFFIAGGSIFSTLNNTSYNDIDVFFYNKDDAEKISNNVNRVPRAFKTKNAITVNNLALGELSTSKDVNHSINTQFITLKFGSIENVFNTFDINCSKCAIDSNYVFHKSHDCSSIISVDLSQATGSTFSRYIKYTGTKNAKDFNKTTLRELIHFFIKNIDKTFSFGYAVDDISAYALINTALSEFFPDYSFHQLVHDTIISIHGNDSIDIFYKIFPLDPANYSDELICAKLYRKQTRAYTCTLLNKDTQLFDKISDKISKETMINVKKKYAEYFI